MPVVQLLETIRRDRANRDVTAVDGHGAEIFGKAFNVPAWDGDRIVLEGEVVGVFVEENIEVVFSAAGDMAAGRVGEAVYIKGRTGRGPFAAYLVKPGDGLADIRSDGPHVLAVIEPEGFEARMDRGRVGMAPLVELVEREVIAFELGHELFGDGG